jgi:enoyl-CoA hydratase/carnithine racemase
LRAGLVDAVVPADDLTAEVARFTGVLSERSALTQRATKQIVAALSAGGDAEAEVAAWYRTTIDSGELAEGVTAFTERRVSRFPWSG